MQIITQTLLSPLQKQSALKIWNAEYPVKLQMPGIVEFDEFLASLTNPKHYLLFTETGNLAGWAALFNIENGRCFFIMINGTYQGKGYGSLLLNGLKKETMNLLGWVIDHNRDIKADGTRYLSPIEFYIKNGFTINSDLRLDTDQLSAVNIKWNAN